MKQKIDYVFTANGLDLTKEIQRQVDRYKIDGYVLHQTDSVVWKGCLYSILTFNKE